MARGPPLTTRPREIYSPTAADVPKNHRSLAGRERGRKLDRRDHDRGRPPPWHAAHRLLGEVRFVRSLGDGLVSLHLRQHSLHVDLMHPRVVLPRTDSLCRSPVIRSVCISNINLGGHLARRSPSCGFGAPQDRSRRLAPPRGAGPSLGPSRRRTAAGEGAAAVCARRADPPSAPRRGRRDNTTTHLPATARRGGASSTSPTPAVPPPVFPGPVAPLGRPPREAAPSPRRGRTAAQFLHPPMVAPHPSGGSTLGTPRKGL